MERLRIDEVIEHCKRYTEMVEAHSSRMQLEETPIGESGFMKRYWEHRQVAEWLEELKRLKDAEENGLLIHLPCKVGDTVYYVDTIRSFIDKCTVKRIKCTFISTKYFRADIECEGQLWHLVSAEVIGKCFFLTREEAEQALKQMGE